MLGVGGIYFFFGSSSDIMFVLFIICQLESGLKRLYLCLGGVGSNELITSQLT